MGKIVEKTADLNANILYLKHEIVADTSKTQARIEFRNMAYGTIAAVKFEARGYNAFGDEIQIDGKPTFDIVAQDLIISPKKYAKLDIVLPNNDIRKLDIRLKQVCYANGKIVDEQLENKVTYKIENLDGTGSLEELEAKRLLKKKNDEAICFPKKIGQNWICICGYLNKNTDTICHQCGCRQIDIFEYCTEEKVQAQINEKKKREAAEQAKQEEERIRLEEEEKRQREEWERQETEQRIKRTRRNKIIAGIVVGIVVCGVIGYLVNEKIIIPNNKYNHAIESINAGQYEAAIGELKELGEYKDASKKIDEAQKAILEEKYVTACKLLEQKSYDDAIRSFNAILEYKDSGDKLLEAKYGKAVNLIEVGEYDNAIEAFKKLGDYSNSEDQINEATYQKAKHYMDEGEYGNASRLFRSLNGYKDSSELVNVAQKGLNYDNAVKMIKDKQFAKGAYKLFKVGEFKDAQKKLRRIPYECEKYIEKKATEQDVSKNNYESASLRAQEGVYEIAGIYATIRDLKKEYDEDANHTQDTENLSESLIDGIDKFCIAGIVSFKSLGDLSRYAEGEFFNNGLQLEKQSAEAIWNFVVKIQEKDVVDKSTFDNLYDAYLQECYEDIDKWIEEGKSIF